MARLTIVMIVLLQALLVTMEMRVRLVKLTMPIVVAQAVLSKMPIVMAYVMLMIFAQVAMTILM